MESRQKAGHQIEAEIGRIARFLGHGPGKRATFLISMLGAELLPGVQAFLLDAAVP